MTGGARGPGPRRGESEKQPSKPLQSSVASAARIPRLALWVGAGTASGSESVILSRVLAWLRAGLWPPHRASRLLPNAVGGGGTC